MPRLTVDLADRHDVALETLGGGVQDRNLDSTNGLIFVSAPLAESTEMSGLFSGRLEFIVSKKDFDFQLALYELTPGGDYIQLAPYWSRASYVENSTRLHELLPGRQQALSFRSMRLMSRRLAAGSRVVAVLSILREPVRQLNYGSGADVSKETIADAKSPLEITWLATSYIDVPASRN